VIGRGITNVLEYKPVKITDMKKMTRNELHQLSQTIDRLDAQVGLSSETIKDVIRRINEAMRRADE
jgi:hypothetical protein